MVVSADGFTLYESRAICKYLAKKYSFPLLPAESDIENAALFDQAQSVEMFYFTEPAGKIAFEKFAKRLMGLPPDPAVVSDALKSLEIFLDIADSTLRRNDYMAGNSFTLIDIYYIPLVQRLFACGHGDIITSREGVNTWWNRCINRPAIGGCWPQTGRLLPVHLRRLQGYSESHASLVMVMKRQNHLYEQDPLGSFSNSACNYLLLAGNICQEEVQFKIENLNSMSRSLLQLDWCRLHCILRGRAGIL